MKTRRLSHLPKHALAVVLISMLAGACSMVMPRTLSFTASEIQQRLAERMPIRRSVAGLLELELRNPAVSLASATQRLATTFDLSLRLPVLLRDATGTVTFSGVPRYDPASRSIFLGQAGVDTLSIEGLPAALASHLQELATRVAEDQFARRPLYTLADGQTRFAGMDLNPSGVRIEGDRLVADLAPR